MTKPFNLGTFQDFLNTYGADIDQWPDDLRSQAEEFLKNNDVAQKAFIEALKIDLMFKGEHGFEAPDHLLSKILQNTEEDKE